MISIPKSNFLDRVNRSAPSAAHIERMINDVYSVADGLEAECARIRSDRNLSEEGKQTSLGATVLSRVNVVCDKSKSYRIARAQIFGQRMALGRPKFDKDDSVGALERMEVRNAIRAEKDPARQWQLAEQFFAQGKSYAEALITGPLTGLPVERLKNLHSRYVREFFGEEAARIDTEEANLEPVRGAVVAVHTMLRSAAGMDGHQYETLVKATEDKIDGRTSG